MHFGLKMFAIFRDFKALVKIEKKHQNRQNLAFLGSLSELIYLDRKPSITARIIWYKNVKLLSG